MILNLFLSPKEIEIIEQLQPVLHTPYAVTEMQKILNRLIP
jgi:hypothetical protein